MELPKDVNILEILSALGLNHQRPNHDWASKLSLFGAGVLVGAGVALLLNPLADQEGHDASEADVSDGDAAQVAAER